MFGSVERAELSALWDELVSGSCKVEGWRHDPESWSVVISRHPAVLAASPPPLRSRDIEILEQALLCGIRKLVAVDVGLSCSSIAVIMQTGFQFMGLDCLPSHIPGLVVAAAHARRHSKGTPISAGALARRREQLRQTISISRPDAALRDWLAPAELAVVRLLVEGMSYAQIAVARHTSIRTVANQVASGFRRLGVSGRAELLCLLARWGLSAPEVPKRRPSLSLPTQGRRSSSNRLRLLEEAASSSAECSPSPAT